MQKSRPKSITAAKFKLQKASADIAPVPVPERSAAQRKVLDAALKLFSDVGYFNTSIPDIVRASKVSTGSIYHHFGDKTGIASALFEQVTQDLQTALDDIEMAHITTGGRCRAIIELMFEITEHSPATMEFMLYAKHKEFLPAHAPICSSAPMTRMRDFVALGIERGEIRAIDATIAAALIYGPAIRLLQLRLDGIIERPLFELLDELWDSSWRSLSTKAG